MLDDLYSLKKNIYRVRKDAERNIPRRISIMMHDQTMYNFDKESYNNDKGSQKWPDRYGITKYGLENVEPFLQYKKLNYTGKLKKKIRRAYDTKYAALIFEAPYAQNHNEGLALNTGGSPYRPPQSSIKVILGRHPKQRKFAGIGTKTKSAAFKFYADSIKENL